MYHLFSLQTVEQCGGIDILISNAAVNPFFGNILDSTDEVWTKVRLRVLLDTDQTLKQSHQHPS